MLPENIQRQLEEAARRLRDNAPAFPESIFAAGVQRAAPANPQMGPELADRGIQAAPHDVNMVVPDLGFAIEQDFRRMGVPTNELYGNPPRYRHVHHVATGPTEAVQELPPMRTHGELVMRRAGASVPPVWPQQGNPLPIVPQPSPQPIAAALTPERLMAAQAASGMPGAERQVYLQPRVNVLGVPPGRQAQRSLIDDIDDTRERQPPFAAPAPPPPTRYAPENSEAGTYASSLPEQPPTMFTQMFNHPPTVTIHSGLTNSASLNPNELSRNLRILGLMVMSQFACSSSTLPKLAMFETR